MRLTFGISSIELIQGFEHGVSGTVVPVLATGFSALLLASLPLKIFVRAGVMKPRLADEEDTGDIEPGVTLDDSELLGEVRSKSEEFSSPDALLAQRIAAAFSVPLAAILAKAAAIAVAVAVVVAVVVAVAVAVAVAAAATEAGRL